MATDLKTPSGHLKEAGARRVLELRTRGWSYARIATELDLSIVTVYNIAKGRTWGWLRGGLQP